MSLEGVYRRPGSRFWWSRDPLTGRRVSTGLEDHEAAIAWRAVRKALVPPREKSPEKRLPAMQFAVSQVGKAVADGKLEKRPCEVCGNPKSYGHHDDYARPLVVRWLCGHHHRAWHLEHGEAPNARITIVAVLNRGGLKTISPKPDPVLDFRAKARAWFAASVTLPRQTVSQ